MTSHQGTVTARPSMFSLNGAGGGGAPISRPAVQNRRSSSFRPCNNCTCSPGLLTRQGRLSNQYQRRLSLRRSSSGKIESPTSSPRRQSSLYTIDAAASQAETSSTNCDSVVKDVNTSARLEKLRYEMAKFDLGVYVIPSTDAHHSEYTSPSDQRRAFISGFSGSAGTAVVTRDITSLNDVPDGVCALATDGRYFTQANNELDFNWRLLKQFTKGEPTWKQWAIQQAEQMSLDSGKEVKIGLDPKLTSYSLYKLFAKEIQEHVSKKKGAKITLVPIKENLVDKIWGDFETYPERVLSGVGYLEDKFTGCSTKQKLAKVQNEMSKYNASTMVLTALDDIAWFLNLRGNDIDYNPVFYSYLLINKDRLILYSDNHARFSKLDKYFKDNNVELKPYEHVFDDLSKLEDTTKVLVPNNASWAIVDSCGSSYELIESPVQELKALKTTEELEGAKLAHKKDGVALCKFFSWLEQQIGVNYELIDEVEASDKLEALRKEQKNFVGLSFETISSTGANAAIIHYAPKRSDCAVIDPNKIYLNDSGAQFLEGTTDTTRTLHFGTPSKEEIDNYTLVLKGHVALASACFPEGSTGFQVDPLARQFLWQQGLDYRHGTGHGVGAYLNVHEGPVSISFRPTSNNFELKPGNLLSNEPGYYKDGEYGIRIENVMFVKDSGVSFGDKSFYNFETITRVPFCHKLINTDMLTKEEKIWINEYHKTVWDDISGDLVKNSFEYNWLKKECSLI